MKKLLAFCLLLAVCWNAAASGLTMRISVENTDSHVQTIAVRDFARRLEQRSEGRLDVRLFTSASLFRDSDAVGAMARGDLEMAVPGTWHIEPLVPEVGVFLLPMFYGMPADVIYRVVEQSPAGDHIIGLIEDDLFVVIPGRWIDLGYTHLFSTKKQIADYQDMAGMRIRVAGGYANEARISSMGGEPTVIAWPDLPERLNQGVVEGVLTSYETVRSARLWNNGISFAFEDKQYFAQYIPMISRSFWNKLDEDLRTLVMDTWEEGVDAARRAAALAQVQARQNLLANEVRISVPGRTEVFQMREHLISRQDEIAETLGIPSRFVGQVKLLTDFFREHE
jgi:C4-dicarboxylate-binding protein DctP